MYYPDLIASIKELKRELTIVQRYVESGSPVEDRYSLIKLQAKIYDIRPDVEEAMYALQKVSCHVED